MEYSSSRPAPAWVRLAASVVKRLPSGRYRAIQELSRRPPAPFVTRTPRELGGSLYQCDLRDSIAREVCFTGIYGPQETHLVRALLRPGMRFVDVGANWGYFTLFGAHLVGSSGRVLSLEPDPRLFRILGENVSRNGFHQVTPVQVAASREAGILSLAGFDENAGNFGLSRIVNEPVRSESVFEVSAMSLDELLPQQGFDQVDLLKMDIEGGEGPAIAGLSSLLAKGRIHRILVELHPHEMAELGFTVEQVKDQLFGAGYRGFTVDHRPETTRRVAYEGVEDFRSLLRPLAPADPLDAWPHMLWLAPGVDLQ